MLSEAGEGAGGVEEEGEGQKNCVIDRLLQALVQLSVREQRIVQSHLEPQVALHHRVGILNPLGNGTHTLKYLTEEFHHEF